MPRKKRYVVDSDVLITAKNAYYAFTICPGFWNSVIQQHQAGFLCSIDRVRAELLMGNKAEDLVIWVKEDLPGAFFEQIDGNVSTKYTEIISWVQANQQFNDAAKARFARGADGWLIAFAAINNAVVVTNELPAPGSKNNIKIPDVCIRFNVEYIGTFRMLRELAVTFHCGKRA